MLTDLDQLGRKLERAAELANRLNEANAVLIAENARLREELDALRGERDAIHDEQARLSAKIADAQVRIQSILSRLPGADERQLDLLDPTTTSTGNTL